MSQDALRHPQPGNFLKLTVPGAREPAIVFRHGETFRIGRTPGICDCVIRVPPAADDRQARRVSRIHAVARFSGGRASVRDGDGVGPSTNGASFAEEKLSADHATVIGRGGVLCLGKVCDVRVEAWFAGHGHAADGTLQEVLEAVAFTPEMPAWPGPAVWLFGVVGVRVDAETGSIGPCAPATAPLAIRHACGGFWLCETPRLMPESRAALETGRRTLGGRDFRVSILTEPAW